MKRNNPILWLWFQAIINWHEISDIVEECYQSVMLFGSYFHSTNIINHIQQPMVLQHHLLPLPREQARQLFIRNQRAELHYIGSGCFLSLCMQVFKLNHTSHEYKHKNAQRYFQNVEQLQLTKYFWIKYSQPLWEQLHLLGLTELVWALFAARTMGGVLSMNSNTEI